MSAPHQPSTPEERDRAKSRLRTLTRSVVVAATGATVGIGILVAHDRPGARASGSTVASSTSSTGDSATSSTGNTGTSNTGNTGTSSTGTSGSSAPSSSSTSPTVTSGGTSS